VDLDGVRWRRSSWSSGQDEDNSNCVEVAMVDTDAWRKSSGEDEDNSNCVEVALGRKSSRSGGQGDPAKTDCGEVAMIDSGRQHASPAALEKSTAASVAAPAIAPVAKPAIAPIVAPAVSATAPITAPATESITASVAFAAIRDSKNPGPALLLPQTAWSGLLDRLVC
jgi:hypothetical protein